MLRYSLALGLALVVLPSFGGSGVEDALTALRRDGIAGGKSTEAEAPAPASIAGMAAPSWGGSDEKAVIPTQPRVPGLPFLQTLVNEAPEGSVLTLPAVLSVAQLLATR